MTQTVLNFSFNQYLPSKAGVGNSSAKAGLPLNRKFFMTFLATVLAFAGMAQTYTTRADGNWNSALTWVGGVVPSATVSASQIINIKHDVTFNLNSDLNVAGTVNITSDTLRFSTSYDKKVLIAATGVLNVKNGGFLQTVSSNKSDMEISGGRIVLEASKFSISKGVKATAGTKRTYINSTLLIGERYEVEGTSTTRSIDTIQTSSIETGINTSSDFNIKSYVTVRVANAKITVTKGNFINAANADITVLTGATNNYGFNLLKTESNLENNGAWDARIDAYCVAKDVKGSNASLIDFTRPEDCSATSTTEAAPELSFINPVLKSGTDKKQGAVYRFSNITPGIDAEVKLKKFSRNDIVMAAFDNATLGWNKAFQPEFGLPGLVAPNQNWYIDFEMTFFVAGTNTKKAVQRADFTALDVDGDGWSIAEYASFSNPANVAYSTFSNLTSSPAGSVGSTLTCPVCNLSSILSQCLVCRGTGEVLGSDCVACSGDGVLFSGCNHPYEGVIGNILQGPVQNFGGIDTAGTAVMATFQYVNVDKINFRYGAKSGALSSNGSGIRLNSLWSKSFSLAPWSMLPVSFSAFTVIADKADANISWQTPNTDNLSHFVVQRSTDGKTYSDIATVFAGASSTYSYKDKNISSGTGIVYYRVVSVDKSEETLYSSVKMIRLTKADAQTIAISTYPNPVSNQVQVTLPNTWQNKAVIFELYTANGTIVKAVQKGGTSQTETIMLNDLPKGLYVVKATCGNETAQQRIVKN